MQENLKQAFMRGVCALNIEAMNALNPKTGTPNYFTGQPLQPSMLMNTVDMMQRNDMTMKVVEPIKMESIKRSEVFDSLAARSMEQIDAQLAISPAKSIEIESMEHRYPTEPITVPKEVKQEVMVERQPEGKIIRVNKYGKSYTDTSTTKPKPPIKKKGFK